MLNDTTTRPVKPEKALEEIKMFLDRALRATSKEIEQTNKRDGCYNPRGIDPQIIVRSGVGIRR